MYWRIIVCTSIIRNVGSHSKCNLLGLKRRNCFKLKNTSKQFYYLKCFSHLHQSGTSLILIFVLFAYSHVLSKINTTFFFLFVVYTFSGPNTPNSKMAVAQKDLGKAARKRGISGQWQNHSVFTVGNRV